MRYIKHPTGNKNTARRDHTKMAETSSENNTSRVEIDWERHAGENVTQRKKYRELLVFQCRSHLSY